ncbi:MAG: hypothetical protein KIS61_21940 [Candidatus Eremiobacteraeota bacterium]|nr:hypothetical protein [Candidatus Eremiobacteraeota bacterium]
MADYEQSDAVPGRLLWFGAGVWLLVAFSALAMGWLHRTWHQPGGPLTAATPLRVEPVVERDPPELHRYQWVDHSQGLVQIPIEEAMQVVSQGGSRASGATAIPTLGDPAGGRTGPPFRTTSRSSTPRGEPDR